MAFTASEFIEKLWNNPEDMQKFADAPKQFLADNGESVPEDVEVHAHIDTVSTRNFVLPADKSELPDGENVILGVVRKAMDDPAFKAELKEHPKEACAKGGLQIPEGIAVNVFENTPTQRHVAVPFNPAKAEMSDADLDAVAGGLDAEDQCTLVGVGQGVACGAAAFFTFGTTAIMSGVAGGTTTVMSVAGKNS